MSSDLSRSLVDAAAAALGDTTCGHNSDIGDVSCTQCDGQAAVAAVLETLAERSAVMERAHDGWGVFDADELRGLAAEVKTEEGR